MKKLYELLDGLYEEMVEIRRHLHQYPELSFEEVETPKFIAAFHKKLGHDVRTNVGGQGVVATLRGEKPGPTVALRADFDALPIQEENEAAYRSKVDGVMHACGHDGHTATLLGVAKALNKLKSELEGSVIFIHQHAEELPPGGAIAMIEDGCLDGVDVIFGTHLWATAPLGEIGYKVGPFMAAADRFDIKIQGYGGHASQPERTKDSIVVGSQLVTNLQQIVSRRVSPLDNAVVSVCSFEAKNPFNIIADSAVLTGTVRTFKEDTRDFIEEEIERIIKGTCLTANVSYDYKFLRGYPATVNHKEETEFIAKTAENVPDVQSVKEYEPRMGAEDFAYYLQHVKGTFFMTGAKIAGRETYPHHHAKFDFDEKALLIAAKVLGSAVLSYMKEN
ncbi:M20 family metallopeptidase [Metabacillus fastidiosus]|uniref:M20 family metallopeptidase n=1 Tax=Metabacillus fastidiosus TaxID=1458 RepID=UPI002DBD684A|nr:M20 family metallopeptidase [Metabacillus fastidiosus]MEC2077432.1 M20 family metallopeptidase [Metabacillus fastidiosus]